mmetsp:Transcript_11542/g.14536  ORF Transcript_11542/g.14536 Transcript_11542/m.14536 type:complete len:80 (+) Transcript_11542:437-676(+)|eukprot:CAMPEP_0170465592 /NCGR_PEP_ID=MMETSP0123-20130129/9884_1 /TAXON_ID=182087 /ORGANISM="Favella ehrenbergii, Strain Fehren 1" /LENGTH=79 /DNA_ID=CAMNT_0010731539 /DNA_START=416 /DNA_END=655 /DNA_ORIENTATION=-
MLGKFFNDILRAQFYLQLDYQDCKYGILGLTAQSDHAECEWQTYYVNKPIVDILIASESESEIYRSTGCGATVIPRYDA